MFLRRREITCGKVGERSPDMADSISLRLRSVLVDNVISAHAREDGSFGATVTVLRGKDRYNLYFEIRPTGRTDLLRGDEQIFTIEQLGMGFRVED